MTKKETKLEDKAIDIHGKKYVLVKDRIIEFNKLYPKGSIVTKLVSEPGADMVIFRAVVYPEATEQSRRYTGYSQAKWGGAGVNKTAALENAETSAVGRAMAMLGIGVIDSVASADEMNKAGANKEYDPEDVSLIESVKKRYPNDKFVINVAKWFKEKRFITTKQRKSMQDLLKQPYQEAEVGDMEEAMARDK